MFHQLLDTFGLARSVDAHKWISTTSTECLVKCDETVQGTTNEMWLAWRGGERAVTYAA